MWKSIFFVQIDMAEPVEIGELDEPRGDRHHTKEAYFSSKFRNGCGEPFGHFLVVLFFLFCSIRYVLEGVCCEAMIGFH